MLPQKGWTNFNHRWWVRMSIKYSTLYVNLLKYALFEITFFHMAPSSEPPKLKAESVFKVYFLHTGVININANEELQTSSPLK